jgi:hypothetical protein
MRYLTKDEARTPKRATVPLCLPEFDAPLLIADEASAGVGLRLRERKVPLTSEEGISAMVADMVLNPDGSRMFSPEEVPAFLDGLSLTSATVLLTACAAKKTGGGGGTGNSQPSTSAA